MITLENVSFTYAQGETDRGLKNISLTIPRGQFVLLCGESGCGKTTMTRLINGLIPHYYKGSLSGSVRVHDLEVHKHPLHETSRKIGSVFQNPKTQFFSVDTTSELAFGAENRGLDPEEIQRRIDHTVKQLHLKTLMGRSLFQLSGGEKQKIACASVSVCEPSVLVLDEPSSNLDASAAAELKEILMYWKSQGKTIIICEHRLHFLRDLADRVLYMKEGRIEKDIPMEHLRSLPAQQLKSMGLRPLYLEHLSQALPEQKDNTSSILLKNFHFCYKKRRGDALNISSASLPSPGITAVIGRNGAGKSTLAACLCGLEKRCKGELHGDGDILRTRKRLKQFYLVMQDVNHQLFTESVLDEVLISMDEPDERKALEILDSLDLTAFKDRHPMSLSGGQKQRCAIAGAIASGSNYILFDEPTSGLDLRHMIEVAENIKNLYTQGKTIFVITHDPELIAACCTHVLHMEKGEVKEGYPLNRRGMEKVLDFFRI